MTRTLDTAAAAPDRAAEPPATEPAGAADTLTGPVPTLIQDFLADPDVDVDVDVGTWTSPTPAAGHTGAGSCVIAARAVRSGRGARTGTARPGTDRARATGGAFVTPARAGVSTAISVNDDNPTAALTANATGARPRPRPRPRRDSRPEPWLGREDLVITTSTRSGTT